MGAGLFRPMKDVNSVSFSKEDVEVGLHLDFIKQLINYNYKTSSSFYNDIHIKYDGYTTTVEWFENSLDEYFGDFEFVDSEHEVMYIGTMPDSTYNYYSSKDEYNKALEDFLKKNPWYIRNDFGRWIDSRETK